MPNRFLAALPLSFALLFPGSAALAAAPMAGTEAPGFYRTMLGDFEVTVLLDGTLGLHPTKLLTNVTPDEVQRALAAAHQTEPVPTSVNGFLINTGAKLVLIDAGTGKAGGPTVGRLKANLEASGYKPGQVDEIYITHLHFDHVGGLSDGGQAVFPNAVVRADRRDADHWLSTANMEKAPEGARSFFKMAQDALQPYVASGRFKPFDGATELVPGIRTVSAYGHTPGHTIYSVESKGRKLMLWGDLMHVHAVQFERPEVTIQFDTDSKAAMEQRQRAFADAAEHRHLVGVAHLPFPGLGYLSASGSGYRFRPLDYAPLK